MEGGIRSPWSPKLPGGFLATEVPAREAGPEITKQGRHQ